VSEFDNLDYYALLGVSRSASLDEIKRAYRREISKFHPDRFANGTPEEQAYASARSQRLTEAYRVLSDFSSRNAYNRSQPTPSASRTPRAAPTPAQPRDHQAELYEQAQRHLADDRLLQGIGVLRQLQQINPFYILHSQFYIPLALPLLVRRVLAADDPDDATPLDDLAAIAALLD